MWPVSRIVLLASQKNNSDCSIITEENPKDMAVNNNSNNLNSPKGIILQGALGNPLKFEIINKFCTINYDTILPS